MTVCGLQLGETNRADGDAPANSSKQHVKSCPVISRTAASGVFEGVLKGHAGVLKSACRRPQGKASLAKWAMETEDVGDLQEALLRSAELYRDEDWASSSDDDDGL